MERYQSLSPARRLQIVLLLMAVWDIVGAVVQLYADSFAFDLQGDVEGILAARAFSGALVVPAVLYLYALRDPLRHRGILWLAVIEQLLAICTAVFHFAADDFGFGSVIIPLAVAVAFLLLVLLELPRAAAGAQESESLGEASSEGE